MERRWWETRSFAIVLIFAYNKAKGVPTTDEEGAGAGFDVSF